MKLPKLTIVIKPESLDEFPELYAVGRGADPRGHDIEAWEREEAARLERVEASRRAAEAEAAAKKPEAAE